MTPMSKANIQALFTRLSKETQHFTNKVELNHSSRNQINSDFIRIYQNDKNKERDSFAFSFNNYKDDINNSEIIVSTLKDNFYESSKTLTLKEFEALFKSFIADALNVNDLTYSQLVDKLKVYFSISQSNNLDFNKLVSTIIEIETNFQEQVDDADRELSEAQKQLIAVEEEIRKKVEAYRLEIQLEMNHKTFANQFQNASRKQKLVLQNQSELIVTVCSKEIEKYPALKRQTFIKNLSTCLFKEDLKMSNRLKHSLTSYNWLLAFEKKGKD